MVNRKLMNNNTQKKGKCTLKNIFKGIRMGFSVILVILIGVFVIIVPLTVAFAPVF